VAGPKAFARFAAVPSRGGLGGWTAALAEGNRPRPSRGAGPPRRLAGAFPPPVPATGFIHCRREAGLRGGSLAAGARPRALWGRCGGGSPGVPALQAGQAGGLLPSRGFSANGSAQLSGGIFQLLKLWVLLGFYFGGVFFFSNLHVVSVGKCDCIWGFTSNWFCLPLPPGETTDSVGIGVMP